MITTRPEWTFAMPHRPKRLQTTDNWCHLCGVAVSGACPLCPDCLADESDYFDYQDMIRDLGPMLS